jgi:DNA-binding transcriptional MerR regulator
MGVAAGAVTVWRASGGWMADESFEFQAPNRAQMWHDLALTMSQAAALTGVSERQIQHWMDRGYIETHDAGTRKINGDNLDMIVLIRQARVAGVPLRRSVALARAFLHQERREGLDGRVSTTAVDALVEQLRSVRTDLGVLEVLLTDTRPTLSVAASDGVSSGR